MDNYPIIEAKEDTNESGFELGFDHWGTICPLG